MPFTPIIVKAIPAYHQRYETVGDWIEPTVETGAAHILVTDTGIDDYTFLIALHELVEYYLCHRVGVTQAQVDTFDKEWESTKKAFEGEPGDDPSAPYHMQHEFAEIIERMVAHNIGVNWGTYESEVNKAWYKTKRHLERERKKKG